MKKIVMFEDIFRRKRIVVDKMLPYGFQMIGSVYQYVAEIQKGEFVLTIRIDEEGSVDTDLVEKENGESYVLYKTNAAGTYVGEIRTAIEEVLSDIADKCYETAIFKEDQAQMAIQFVKEKYGGELEFLWTKFPDNAVWRRKDNKKWYGAILTVVGRKIGLDTDKVIEIIDLRMNPDEAEDVLSRDHYYPGWHMNKKSWYTIALDGSVSDEELKNRIAESYELAGK